MTDILLINPPFMDPSRPYISIPTLVPYLRSKGIDTRVLDLNQEFFCRFPSVEKVSAGQRYIQERFVALNSKSQLLCSEGFEYLSLWGLLNGLRRHRKEILALLSGFVDCAGLQDFHCLNFLVGLCSAPYFPERIQTYPYFLAPSPFQSTSTADLLRSIHHESAYLNIFADILKQALGSTRPKVVGLSVIFKEQIIPAFQCAAIIRQLAPEAHLTMGGPMISIHMHALPNGDLFQVVDSLVLGAGELPLVELFRELANDPPDLQKVPGLIYLAGNRVCNNGPASRPAEARSLAPDYRVFQLDRYLTPPQELILTLRLEEGCPWHACSFCRTRLSFVNAHHSPPREVMYEQLKQVVLETGARVITFSDDAPSPETLEYLARRLIQDKLEIEWHAHTRVQKSLTRERCRLFREAGCRGLRLGVETFSDRLLKLLKKGITARLIEEVIEQIQNEVPVSLYMMIGIPTETEQEALLSQQRIQYLQRKGLIKDTVYTYFVLQHGSEMGLRPEAFGISKVEWPAGCDLLPDTCNFSSTGMSRRRAYELARKFNGRMDYIDRLLSSNKGQIKIDGEPVAVRYNIRELHNLLSSRWELSYLNLCQFMQQNDVQMPPIKPLQS